MSSRRKAPVEKAKLYNDGYLACGSDGLAYIVKSVKNGVKRWLMKIDKTFDVPNRTPIDDLQLILHGNCDLTEINSVKTRIIKEIAIAISTKKDVTGIGSLDPMELENDINRLLTNTDNTTAVPNRTPVDDLQMILHGNCDLAEMIASCMHIIKEMSIAIFAKKH